MSFPFPFIEHGPLEWPVQQLVVNIVFGSPLNAAAKRVIEKDIPSPFTKSWGTQVLEMRYGLSDEDLSNSVTGRDDLMIVLEQWLLAVHERYSIAVVFREPDPYYKLPTDEWHTWSCEQFPNVAVQLIALPKRYSSLISVYLYAWRQHLRNLSIELQAAAKALSPDVRAALRGRYSNEPIPLGITLEDALHLWQGMDSPSPHQYQRLMLDRNIQHFSVFWLVNWLLTVTKCNLPTTSIQRQV